MPGSSIANLARRTTALTRSLSPENPTGEPGQGGRASEGTGAASARDLGRGWKINPCIRIPAGSTATIAEVSGPGTIQHIWMTIGGNWRYSILRIYWDGQAQPSVEVPVGDFFCCPWGREDGALHQGANFRALSSLAVCVNPANAFNCYWPMPFRAGCRITIENLQVGSGTEPAKGEVTLFYQITYAEGPVEADCAYFHAQWRRSDPVPPGAVHTLLEGVEQPGHYVGTALGWGSRSDGWWGEGEIKFFMDGDGEFPTICGTGTEDYFCGSYNFDCGREHGGYREFSSPYSGLHQVLRPDGLYRSQMRFSMYRWHLADPVRFARTLRVTIQALGWRSGGRYKQLEDDLASTAFWYQLLPTAAFPRLPNRDRLEVT